MTTLFIKITNQIITKCKEHINPDVRKPEKLWKLPKPELIESMQVRAVTTGHLLCPFEVLIILVSSSGVG